jgi:Flp pilus assembly protein TadD
MVTEKETHTTIELISPEVLYLHRYANELASKGLFQQAVEYLDKAISANPGNSCLWNDKGVILDGLDRTAEALSCYEKAIENDPYHAEAWFNKGVALRKTGHDQECDTCHRIASCLEQGRDIRSLFPNLPELNKKR